MWVAICTEIARIGHPLAAALTLIMEGAIKEEMEEQFGDSHPGCLFLAPFKVAAKTGANAAGTAPAEAAEEEVCSATTVIVKKPVYKTRAQEVDHEEGVGEDEREEGREGGQQRKLTEH